MTRKRVRAEHETPPLVQVVPGLAHVGGSLALLRPLVSTMGVRTIADGLVPMQREREGSISHGQVIETVIANRLVSPRPFPASPSGPRHKASVVRAPEGIVEVSPNNLRRIFYAKSVLLMPSWPGIHR